MKPILLIDDNEITLKSLSKALELNGILNHKFLDPLQAIEHYRKNIPEIVITDYKMPVMKGTQVLEEIRKINPKAEFIVYTGYPQDSILRKIEKANAKWFIKPIKIIEMIDYIEKKLENLKEES